MTALVGSTRDDLADDWLTTAALHKRQSHDPAKPFPKRSELRRAEARAANRRGANRRPPGGRPPGEATGRHSPPQLTASGHGAEPGRRCRAAPWVPIAVAPTASALPIRQTSTQTRPAGIDVPVPAPSSPDAFYPAAPAGAPLPLAVPVFEFDDAHSQPIAPAEPAAPVTASLNPAEWSLEIEAGPASGRRRGADDTAPDSRRPPSAPTVPLPARLFGRGKASAARLLVLALVVGAEGVAVTSMAGRARTAPVDPRTAGITGADQLAELSPNPVPAAVALQEAAEGQRSATDATKETLPAAHDESSKAKVTAALQQAKAAADRVKSEQAKAAAERAKAAKQARAIKRAKAIKRLKALRQTKATEPKKTTPQAKAPKRSKTAADRRAQTIRNARKDPRSVGRTMAAERGWGASQFNCLNQLWNRESQWNYRASNPSSGAYGIPQALPGGKMISAGSDWRTNPVTQIKWGLSYIADRYGTPCGAWEHSESVGWY
ncbi:MAG TPA: hypothetical protein VLL08_20080 [Kineosporiaceae bacterium]|nr:hypothetical protein [Kineosporiaceae bacterium]